MNQLVVLEQLRPLDIFTSQGTSDILDKIKKEARSHVLDISTDKGREQIRSLAYTIARSKTLLDDMGKELVAEQKKQLAQVDVERKRIRDELDALKEEVRAPLTEWEDAEKHRVEGHEAALKLIEVLTRFDAPHPASAEVQKRLENVEAAKARDWQEFGKRAQLAYDATRTALNETLAASLKHEDDQAELERLRREEVERKAREREEQIRAEAAAKAKADAEEEARKVAEAEAVRVRAEQQKAEMERLRVLKEKEEADARAKKAEEDRLEAVAKAEADRKAAAAKSKAEAEERARKDAVRVKAEQDRAEQERERLECERAEAEARAKKAEEDRLAAIQKAESDSKAAAERAAADAKAAAEKAEHEKEAAVRAERERAEASRKAEAVAAAKREADKKHRGRINSEALAALLAAGLSPDASKAAVEAIAKGQIPHIKICY